MLGLSLRDEFSKANRAFRRIDRQTAVVLLAAALLVIFQMKWGDRTFFRTTIAPIFELEGRGLASWIWWFGMQGVLGFLLPVLILKFGFKQSWKDMGLGLGDYSFALKIMVLYMPIVAIGTWVLSDLSSFQASYPHYSPAASNWATFFAFEACFLLYWIGWEYLWRGFVLFGTAKTFGVMAIIVQTMPFAIMHFDKPFPEALLSVVGGVALGALVWRSRSFWIAVPIHAAQMMLLDFWCTMRARTGASGIGFEALTNLFSGLGN